MGALTRPFAVAAAWLSDHPFRLAGGLAAVGGSLVTYLGVGAEATVRDVTAFAVAHPAYPAAILVGVAALLFVDG